MKATNPVKMVKELIKWRESASCIILAKNNHKKIEDKNNYNVLLFNRSEKASFMPKASVFPGGVREPADESLNWLEHFQRFGLTEQRLRSDLCIDRSKHTFLKPSIFQSTNDKCLPRDISLRITAIRETFEEVGIMLCRDRESLKHLGENRNFGYHKEDFDREHWQHIVHNDATQFLKLCQMLDVIPDLWNLHEWSAWITPAVFPKRFETVFYIVAMETEPYVVLDRNECIDYSWGSPACFLDAHARKDCWLAPPQLYELTRFSNINELDTLMDFVKHRAKHGSMLMLPVMATSADSKMISLFPGDSLYPENPHLVNDIIAFDKKMEDLHVDSPKLHRYHETVIRQHNKFQINIEFPDKQISPVASKPLANL